MSREKGKPYHFAQKNKNMYCYCCDCETTWNYVLGQVRYNGIKSCLECIECGEIIPAFAVDSYQKRGIPVIPV